MYAVFVFKRGDFFGELALMMEQPRAATIEASSPVRCLRLGADVFKQLVSGSSKLGAAMEKQQRCA